MVVQMDTKKTIAETRLRLVETGGRTSHDLGAGRIVGMVLVYLYLQEDECSLDQIGEELGLSKASVSIAARQLEQLGLVRRIWLRGNRKKFYRSADNIAQAIQRGILGIVQTKVKSFGEELELSRQVLADAPSQESAELQFLSRRVGRAVKLQKRLSRFLNNPLVKILSRENP